MASAVRVPLPKRGITSACVNQSVSQQHHNRLKQSDHLLLSSRGRLVQNPISATTQLSEHDQRLYRSICSFSSQQSLKILEIIKQNQHNIQHISIYGKAMQKCNWAKDWKSVKKIMDLLLSNEANVEMETIPFHVFMNSMARSHERHVIRDIMQCFHSMVNQYRLQPDLITFGILFKAFASHRQFDLAQKCWNLMRTKFGLAPDAMSFVQLLNVYAKCGALQSAKTLFAEYLDKAQLNPQLYHSAVLNAYLNVFAETGDLKEVQRVLKIINQTHDLHLDPIGMMTVFKCLVSAQKYEKCLKMIRNYTDVLNNSHSMEVLLVMKCQCLSRWINSQQLTMTHKYDLYAQLKRTIYEELPRHGLHLNSCFARLQLQAAVHLYTDHDVQKIIELFEEFVAKQLIGYISTSHRFITGRHHIDLHGFHLIEARFVIRYLFACKTQEVLDSAEDDGLIRIVVGKGLNSQGLQHEKGALKELIVEEMNSWQPPIRAIVDECNSGVIVIDSKDMQPYLRHTENYLTRILGFKNSVHHQ